MMMMMILLVFSEQFVVEDDFMTSFHKQKANELCEGIKNVFALEKIKKPDSFK